MTVTIISDGIVWNYNQNKHSFQQLTKQQIMDLQTAKKEIAEKSRKEKGKKLYLNVSNDGEVGISETFIKDSSGFCYRNGSEIALPEDSKSPEPKEKNKTKTIMEKTAVKKAVKKVAAKKATNGKVEGRKVNISIKAMRIGLKKGFIYRDPQGIKQTEKYMATRKNQDLVREGMYESKEK